MNEGPLDPEPGSAPSEPAPESSWPEPEPGTPTLAGEAALPPSPAARPRRQFLAVAGGLVVVVGYLGVKFLLGFVVAGAAAGAIGAVFGGPWDHLPSDTRDRDVARIEAAVGPSFKGLSDADQAKRLADLQAGGLPRLDDATLIDRVGIFAAALNATDEHTCATVMRVSFGDPFDKESAKKLIGSLDSTAFSRWVEIAVEAIEAESKAAPPARKPSDAEANAMFDAVFARISPTDQATIASVQSGTAVSDGVVCAAGRAIYGVGLGLEPAQRATFALTDVQS